MTTPHRTRNHRPWIVRFGVVTAIATSLGWLASPTLAVDVYATAISGEPYGVGTIEIPLDRPALAPDFEPLQVGDATGRVLYSFSEDVRVQPPPPSRQPVPQPGGGRLLNRLGGLLREITQSDEERVETTARRVTFLFTGSTPFNVDVSDSTNQFGTYELRPVVDLAAHDQLVTTFYRGFTEAAKSQIDIGDYPAWVEDYLVAMLSRRLGLPLPTWYTDTKAEDDELLSALKLIGGAEGVGEAIFRRRAAGIVGDDATASVPVPDPPAWARLFDQAGLEDVPVEPMAARVPPECFYIRYGSFANYDWFSQLSAQYGGDVSRMVTLRGFETNTTQRIEDQLHLKTNELSRMLAPQVIDDQAIIGRDLLLGDGASIGVLFKAKNQFLLSTSFNNDRSKLARSRDDVSLQDITIDDHPVTLLSSADNRVRSFMVVDDGFIFVTNSRTLASRFLEVGKSQESLAATASFRLARQLMPLEREDTVFAYFSPQMMRGLLSPQYLIELRRRLAAEAEISQVHLARLAAGQESPPGTRIGIDELINDGFLPPNFGVRADGSGAIEVGDQVMDTRRGARGNFLPIVDAKIDAVTPDEYRWYTDIAQQYEQRFPTLDPIMVGVRRGAIDGLPGGERITIHAEIAPWDPEKYGKWAKQLGPPTDVVMQFAPDDIVAAQAHVASPMIGLPTHLFVAIKDTLPPNPDDFDGILNIYRSLRSIPGYLGAWPQPGALDQLPLGLGVGTPIGPGMSRLIGGLYRYTDGQYSLLSFQPDILNAALPHLVAGQSDTSAQLRVQVGNLSESQLERWGNQQLYDRARVTSLAGASFCSLLSRQLNVPPDRVADVAEDIWGVRLQCPLGGQYEYNAAIGRWTSTAWNGVVPPMIAPAAYVAPPMSWFRGAYADVTQYADRLVADAVIDVQR